MPHLGLEARKLAEESERTLVADPVSLGVDVGASLAKLVSRDGGAVRQELLPAAELERVAERVATLGPRTLGLTGAGASELARRVDGESVRVTEFAAWGAGVRRLLAAQRSDVVEPYLLVSVGTGTSVLLAQGMGVSRVGGTALGGGTVMGLGGLLLGGASFEEISALAAKGDRRRVDLLVSDIYRPGEIALLGDATAANFGKPAVHEGRPAPADLSHAIMGLVGENVALICAGLAAAHGVHRVVYGGSTLRANPVLRDVLGLITAAFGREPILLDGGEFAGALGALELSGG
jgi:type II pantothenate kinase